MVLGGKIAALDRDMQSLSTVVETKPEQSQRSWAPPRKPWVLAMRWHDLLFMHWPVRPDTIRPLISNEVALDTFDGWAWIGIVPFHMSRVRLRFTPPEPAGLHSSSAPSAVSCRSCRRVASLAP